MFEFITAYSAELVLGYSILPIIRDGAWGIHTGICAKDEDILNGENNGICVTCHKGFDYHFAGAAPIVAGAITVVEHLLSLISVHFPDVAQEGIIIVSRSEEHTSELQSL